MIKRVISTAIGVLLAARVLAYAAGDRVGLTDPGTPPIGPGYWMWSGGPIARSNLGARPIFLASADEFRPVAPPVFGSAEFNAALDLHCRQASKIVEEFAGSWFSKTNWERGISPEDVRGFAWVALKKLRAELRKGGGGE